MARKAKPVKDLSLEIDILSEKFKKVENKVIEKDEKLRELEIIIKENREKIDQLEKMLTEMTKKLKIKEDKFICKECGKKFSSKSELTVHIRSSHPKEYKCKICEKTFTDSWKIELHSKSHEKIVPFVCNICEKKFYVEWRMKKHILSHDQKQKFCHFYNNGKDCPYYEIGCKFKHQEAKKCKYDNNCPFTLCQFQHSISKADLKENGNKDKIDEGENYTKYDSMTEYDQFDVYQEICLTICWSGFHKCMDYDEDNELLGVDVGKIRDDYNNRREEKFHCEKCIFFSKDMEDVKVHYLKKHTISYTCWECDKVIETITEFKRHYGSNHFIAEEEIDN